MKYDWDRLKVAWITGGYKSIREFADAEGVAYNADTRLKVSKWKKEKLTKSRQKTNKTIAKTIEKVSEIESDRNARHIALWDLIMQKGEQVARDELNTVLDMFGKTHETKIIDAGKLEIVSKIVDRAQKGHRLALGLDKDKGDEKPIEIRISRKAKADD